MEEERFFKLLSIQDIQEIATLGQQLNPSLGIGDVRDYLIQMFEFQSYQCFGLYIGQQLVGIASGWITVRLYSGKQLELDNVIIHSEMQSKMFYINKG